MRMEFKMLYAMHDDRMKIILNQTDSCNATMLCYISGYMGTNPEFQKAFDDALDNMTHIEFNKE